MTLPFGEKFDLLISFEFQVILFQAPCVLNDKFFNGMSHLRHVLKRPCGPPMEMVAGSTGAVAFEPAGPSSPRPAPPNPGQLVKVLLHERETGMSMGHMFVGVEVVRSVSKELGWGRSAQRFTSKAREDFTGVQGGTYPGCEYTCAQSIPTLAQPREISTFKGRT